MAQGLGKTEPATARLRKAGLSHAAAQRVMSGRKRKTPFVLYVAGALGFALLGAGAFTAWSQSGTDSMTTTRTAAVQEGAESTNASSPTAALATPQDIVISQRADTTLAFSLTEVPGALPPAPAPAPVIRPTPQLKPAADVVAARDCVDNLQDIMAQTVIGFDAGSTGINADGRDTLRMLGIAVRYCPQAHIVVAGHSDPSGDEASNLKLSWDRADSALAVLADLDLLVDNFEPMGFGSQLPFAQGDASEDAENRRVDFQITRITEGGN